MNGNLTQRIIMDYCCLDFKEHVENTYAGYGLTRFVQRDDGMWNVFGLGGRVIIMDMRFCPFCGFRLDLIRS